MNYFYSLILLSAGGGVRFKAKKQFQKLNGLPLWLYSLNTFLKIKSVKQIIFVINKADKSKYEKTIKQIYKQTFSKITFTEGGKERYHSSFNGLTQVVPESDFVLIHDVARPFIDKTDLKNLMGSPENKSHAIIPAMPISDSVKVIGRSNYIEKSLPREKLISVSTPQIFPTVLIKKLMLILCRKSNHFPLMIVKFF